MLNPKSLAMLALAASSLAGAAQAGQCRDPWITYAIRRVSGHDPLGNYESLDCTYTQYGGGHWNSYPELEGYVRQTWPGRWGSSSHLQLAPQASNFSVWSSSLGYPANVAPAPGRTVNYNGRSYVVGQVIAQGGGNVIAQGGGNVIAQGGGNLVVRLVSTNGGN